MMKLTLHALKVKEIIWMETISPSNVADGEVEYIFPFYYDGKGYDHCVLFDESGFVYPVLRCPTHYISTKTSDGINSFPVIQLIRAPFSRCRNNQFIFPFRDLILLHSQGFWHNWRRSYVSIHWNHIYSSDLITC